MPYQHKRFSPYQLEGGVPRLEISERPKPPATLGERLQGRRLLVPQGIDGIFDCGLDCMITHRHENKEENTACGS